jgi:hypothetical protein
VRGEYVDSHGCGVRWEVIEAHDNTGELYIGDQVLDMIDRADTVFYRIDTGVEEYYRWIGGPFEDESSLQRAIEDEGEFYE